VQCSASHVDRNIKQTKTFRDVTSRVIHGTVNTIIKIYYIRRSRRPFALLNQQARQL